MLYKAWSIFATNYKLLIRTPPYSPKNEKSGVRRNDFNIIFLVRKLSFLSKGHLLWTYPANKMRLVQICILASATKAPKQAEIHSHRTTRRQYLRWYQAKQPSCWKQGTEILIPRPGFFLPFPSRLGSWGLIPLRYLACLCRWQSYTLSVAMTWNQLRGRPHF